MLSLVKKKICYLLHVQGYHQRETDNGQIFGVFKDNQKVLNW